MKAEEMNAKEKSVRETGAKETGAKETDECVSIVVNGEARSAARGVTVTQLLALLGIHSGRVAIERNLQILSRSAWNETQVAEGDRYEIVQFVGGG
jgi:sulfur carrier protein